MTDERNKKIAITLYISYWSIISVRKNNVKETISISRNNSFKG